MKLEVFKSEAEKVAEDNVPVTLSLVNEDSKVCVVARKGDSTTTLCVITPKGISRCSHVDSSFGFELTANYNRLVDIS